MMAQDTGSPECTASPENAGTPPNENIMHPIFRVEFIKHLYWAAESDSESCCGDTVSSSSVTDGKSLPSPLDSPCVSQPITRQEEQLTRIGGIYQSRTNGVDSYHEAVAMLNGMIGGRIVFDRLTTISNAAMDEYLTDVEPCSPVDTDMPECQDILEGVQKEEKMIDIVATLNNLGVVLYDRCDYFQAGDCYAKAMQLIDEMKYEQVPPDLLVKVSGNLTMNLWKMGQLDKALDLAEETLDMVCEIFGETKPHIQIVLHLNTLAMIQTDRGEHQNARDILCQALALMEEMPEEDIDYDLLAVVKGNLADSYREAGLLDDALTFGLMSLELIKKTYGKKRPNLRTVKVLNTLAQIHNERGDHHAAYTYWSRANTMVDKLEEHTIDNALLGEMYEHMANNYRQMGLLDKALSCAEHSLNITSKMYGTTRPHVKIITRMNTLGLVHSQRGDYNKADGVWSKAVALAMMAGITSRTASNKNAVLLASLKGNMADNYIHLGILDKAMVLAKESLDILSGVYGENTPHVKIAQRLSTLGVIYSGRGMYDKAEELLSRAASMLQSMDDSGIDYCVLSVVKRNMAENYRCMGILDKALSLAQQAVDVTYKVYYRDVTSLEKAVKTAKKVKGNKNCEHQDDSASHLNVAIAVNTLGRILSDKGQCNKAEKIMYEALHMMYKAVGKKTPHPTIADIRENLAINHQRFNELDEALKMLDLCLDIRCQIYADNPDHYLIAKALTLSGDFYISKYNLIDAKECYQRAFAMMAKQSRDHGKLLEDIKQGMAKILLLKHYIP